MDHPEAAPPGAQLHPAVLTAATDPAAAQRTLTGLLRSGADPEHPDEDGVTPLYLASVQGAADLVRLLLRAGADPDRPGGTEGLPLCAAAAGGHTDAVRALLTAGARPDAREEFGFTPLAWAISGGHTAIVTALLDAGGDPDLPGPEEEPPLVAAARRGSPAIVRALLEHGGSAGRTEALAEARRRAALDVPAELTRTLLAHRTGTPRVVTERSHHDGTERVTVRLLDPTGALRAGGDRDLGHAGIVALLLASTDPRTP
ncbi:ankyrin repeat domain-containing protein [Streptomyces uncialis]|uniref:ankyrin repeat domain-containing protein n=1 Tax=Streptomyces uncialis TaxID=1048205 RepID=UPI0033ED2B44